MSFKHSLKSWSNTGIPWMIGWCFTFTVTMSIAKFLSQDTSIIMMVFIRCFFGFLVLVPFMLRKGTELFHIKQHGWYVFRILCASIAMTCTYTAYTRLPLAFATSVGFTSPIIIALLSMLVFRDYLTWRQWSAVIVGYLGVLTMVNPQAGSDYVGIAIALCANIFTAMAILVTKQLTKTEDSMSILIYTTTGIFVLVSLCVPFAWHPPSIQTTALLCLMGTIATFSQWLYVQAIKCGRPALLASFEYSRLVLAIPIGLWVFSESPSVALFFGSIMIIASNAYMAYSSREKAS